MTQRMRSLTIFVQQPRAAARIVHSVREHTQILAAIYKFVRNAHSASAPTPGAAAGVARAVLGGPSNTPLPRPTDIDDDGRCMHNLSGLTV